MPSPFISEEHIKAVGRRGGTDGMQYRAVFMRYCRNNGLCARHQDIWGTEAVLRMAEIGILRSILYAAASTLFVVCCSL